MKTIKITEATVQMLDRIQMLQGKMGDRYEVLSQPTIIEYAVLEFLRSTEGFVRELESKGK